MKEMNNKEIFKRVIKTDKREIEMLLYDAMEFLCNKKKEGFVQDTDEFFFRLTLDELLENAMKHGNKYEYEKNITLSLVPTLRNIELQVEDEGNGFSLEKIPKPHQEDKFKKSGRGIHIIQEVSKLTTNAKGNCIIAKL